MKRKILMIALIIVSTHYYITAQSTTAGAGPIGHTGAVAATDWCGWNAASPISFNLEHRGTQNINFLTGGVQRMTILGAAAANPGFVGIGNGFANPVSLLHLHRPAGNVFLRFTNNGTGATALDGFVIGALNGAVNGDAAFIQYEPNPIRFFVPDINVVGIAPERMQFTYGGQMGGGTADGLRIFNPGYVNSTAQAAFNSIDIYTGINNSTHIRLDNSGNLDTEQLLFKQAARFNGFWFNAAPTATQYATIKAKYVFNIDSIEVMRIGSGLGMGSNVPPGPNSWNVNEGFVRIGEQPNTAVPVNAGNRLEIDAFPNTTFMTPNANCAGSTGFSGLRLTDLTSASSPFTSPATTNVLSVDVNGDVILIPNGAVNFGGACANLNTMSQDFEIPMGDFNYIFTGQSTSNDSRVGIGLPAGVCQPNAKLDVRMSAPQSSTIAISTLNTNTDGIALKAVSNGSASNANTKIAGWFESPFGGGLQQTAIFVPPGGGMVTVGYPVGSTVNGLVDVNGSVCSMNIPLLSDVSLKHNITSIDSSMSIIMNLEPVTFEWNTPSDSMMTGTHSGFIAQQVDTVLPHVVKTGSGNLKTVAYVEMIPYLVGALQEEHLRNNLLESRLDSLTTIVGSCCSSSARMSNPEVDQQDVTLNNSESIVLNQNVPNPFAEQTTITYILPESVVKAQMLFYDAQGKLIRAIDLDGRGQAQINVFADDLSNGIYSYALVADGQVIDTKQMVKSK